MKWRSRSKRSVKILSLRMVEAFQSSQLKETNTQHRSSPRARNRAMSIMGHLLMSPIHHRPLMTKASTPSRSSPRVSYRMISLRSQILQSMIPHVPSTTKPISKPRRKADYQRSTAIEVVRLWEEERGGIETKRGAGIDIVDILMSQPGDPRISPVAHMAKINPEMRKLSLLRTGMNPGASADIRMTEEEGHVGTLVARSVQVLRDRWTKVLCQRVSVGHVGVNTIRVKIETTQGLEQVAHLSVGT